MTEKQKLHEMLVRLFCKWVNGRPLPKGGRGGPDYGDFKGGSGDDVEVKVSMLRLYGAMVTGQYEWGHLLGHGYWPKEYDYLILVGLVPLPNKYRLSFFVFTYVEVTDVLATPNRYQTVTCGASRRLAIKRGNRGMSGFILEHRCGFQETIDFFSRPRLSK